MVGVEGFEPPNNGIKIRGLNRLTIHQCVGDSGENRTHQRMNAICTSTALRFKSNPHIRTSHSGFHARSPLQWSLPKMFPEVLYTSGKIKEEAFIWMSVSAFFDSV